MPSSCLWPSIDDIYLRYKNYRPTKLSHHGLKSGPCFARLTIRLLCRIFEFERGKDSEDDGGRGGSRCMDSESGSFGVIVVVLQADSWLVRVSVALEMI